MKTIITLTCIIVIAGVFFIGHKDGASRSVEKVVSTTHHVNAHSVYNYIKIKDEHKGNRAAQRIK